MDGCGWWAPLNRQLVMVGACCFPQDAYVDLEFLNDVGCVAETGQRGYETWKKLWTSMYESSTENLSLNVWNLQFPLHTNPELTQEKIESMNWSDNRAVVKADQVMPLIDFQMEKHEEHTWEHAEQFI